MKIGKIKEKDLENVSGGYSIDLDTISLGKEEYDALDEAGFISENGIAYKPDEIDSYLKLKGFHGTNFSGPLDSFSELGAIQKCEKSGVFSYVQVDGEDW